MADALSVEAVNQMRIAMGMKPIPVPGDGPIFKEETGEDSDGEEPANTLESREAAAGENWAKLQDEARAKEERQKRKERIKKEREAAARAAKLEGKGIAEIEDDLDMSSWLKGQNKRLKKIEKEEQTKAAQEAARKQAEYTAKDLAGVKVAHQVSQFDEGGEQILILKDQEIGEETDEDELENLDLRDKERLKERLEAKKRKGITYDPNDETGENSILAQYDEEIDGKKQAKFTLDGLGGTREQLENEKSQEEAKSKGVLVNLAALLDDKPVSDYKDVSEIKIKKPKKSKKKTSRKKAYDEEDDIFATNGAMDIDVPLTIAASKSKKRSADDANFEDDEDLQAQLARQRREALKKRKKMRPEDLAKQIKEDEAAEMEGVDAFEGEDGGLLIDETTEFVQQLDPQARREEEEEEEARRERRRQALPQTHTPEGEPEADEDGDTAMQSYAEAEEAAEAAERAKRTPSPEAHEISTTGIDEEQGLAQGLGATLNMLRQRNLITEASATSENWRDRQRFLAERSKREEDAERRARSQRERDRQSGRLDRMTAREREDYARQSNTQREQMESRQLADMFNKEYKPNIELKYVDEYGRNMNQKEAFKHLSHQFHGKGSGKQKHEKLLKKIEDEKKREAASFLDASQRSGGMGDAKKNKQAGVRLQ